MSEYRERDIDDLGDNYFRHISAMTGEKLHSKSAIAAELAFRDMRIAELEAKVAEQQTEIKRLKENKQTLDMLLDEKYDGIEFLLSIIKQIYAMAGEDESVSEICNKALEDTQYG